MVLSLCMIVKDEEKCLGRCLESVKYKVDEIILVDTGSTDNTIKIAERYGAEIFYFPWNGSFSDARNYSIRQAQGDWILILDADDELRCEADELRELVKESAADAYNCEIINYVGDETDCDVVRSRNIRLVRNHKGYFYYNKIHEQISGSILSINSSAAIFSCNIKIYHHGYRDSYIEDKRKRDRNTTILENELRQCPACVSTLYYLASEYCRSGNIKEAIDLYERAYLSFNPKEEFGPSMILRMACCYMELERYSEALVLCDAGLQYYPKFTDLEYVKGEIYRETGNKELALRHYKRCCEMGNAPVGLSVIEGVGSYRPMAAIVDLKLDYVRIDEDITN